MARCWKYRRRSAVRSTANWASLYTNSAAEESGLRWAQHYQFLSQQMAQQLGGPTDVRVEVNKNSPVVWLKTWLQPDICAYR